MQIDKYRRVGSLMEIDYGLGSEGYGLKTLDEPKASLLEAAASVADRALEACGIDVQGKLLAVSWAHGEHPGSRVILEIPSVEGDKPARLALPLISSKPIMDDDAPADCAHNEYLEALALLEAEIGAFLEGKRAQMSLFDADELAPRRAAGE